MRRLYIEEGAAIARELYLSLLVDRETSRVAVVASTEGGMDIEEVAARHAGEDRHLPDRSGHGPLAASRGSSGARRWGSTGDQAKQVRALAAGALQGASSPRT